MRGKTRGAVPPRVGRKAHLSPHLFPQGISPPLSPGHVPPARDKAGPWIQAPASISPEKENTQGARPRVYELLLASPLTGHSPRRGGEPCVSPPLSPTPARG